MRAYAELGEIGLTADRDPVDEEVAEDVVVAER